MDDVAYTLNPLFSEIKINKDLQDNQLLSLYEVNKAGESKGHGLYAKRDIAKDEEVIRATGPIVGPQISNTLYFSYGIDILVQVNHDEWVLPNNESRFINHSCEPNLGLLDNGVFIAMRNIKIGEELTFDYGTIDVNTNWSMSCLCGRKSCRKVITSQDIFDKELNLQEKYKGYIANFVLEEVKKLSI